MDFYHDFRSLGLDLPQKPGIFAPNQAAKMPIIVGYLLFAIGKLRTRGEHPVSVAELFCADAFYSFLARRFGADWCDAFDNDRGGHFAQAEHVKQLLKEPGVRLHRQDVFAIPPDYHASIVVNAGGLYHVADPLAALQLSYRICRHYLILQTVVSLAAEDEDYFEAPAPGSNRGCRFSYAFLRRAIEMRGYAIVDSERNVLTGNDRPEDRGSAYFLIAK